MPIAPEDVLWVEPPRIGLFELGERLVDGDQVRQLRIVGADRAVELDLFTTGAPLEPLGVVWPVPVHPGHLAGGLIGTGRRHDDPHARADHGGQGVPPRYADPVRRVDLRPAGSDHPWSVPGVPPAPDEVAALRAANARLREVIEAKGAGAAALKVQLEACRGQLEELRAEAEALRARLRQNPRNSSRPPSSEGLAKRAEAAVTAEEDRPQARRPGRA